MKTLLIFPPQWMPTSPHFSLPTLIGQFENSGHQACALDLNIDFYNEILTKKSIQDSYNKAKELLPILKEEIKEVFDKNKSFNDYPFEWQNKIAKASMIDNFIRENSKKVNKTILLIENSVSIFKSKQHFYNPYLFNQANSNINLALDIFSLPYSPSQIGFSSYKNQLFKLDYDNIKYYVFDKSTNPFIEFFEKKLELIKSKNADSIGISINSSSQIIPGLTLSNMLKKNTKAHIFIGGNHFGRVSESIEKYSEIFDIFCDSLIVEEGEIPIIEHAKYIAGEIPIEKVHNLMYLKDGKIRKNQIAMPMSLNNMKAPNLDDYDFKKYFAPEIVMPFQTSRGCYWRKCSFCDHDYGLHYNIKSIDKLMNQFKMFKEKYNIDKFELIDEAISPSYMKEMSEAILRNNIKISFFCDARLESEFDEEIFKVAHKAGLKMVLWGFESGSKKIMKLINKGVDIDNRLNILKKARQAGIYNFAFIFFGFPAETKEDALETIDTICSNTDIINTYAKSVFTMGKHTKLREAPEKYGVIGKTYQEAEFSPTYTYQASGMNKKELNDIVNLCTKRAHEAYGDSLAFYLLGRELIMLYLCKYSIDDVCNFKFKK